MDRLLSAVNCIGMIAGFIVILFFRECLPTNTHTVERQVTTIYDSTEKRIPVPGTATLVRTFSFIPVPVDVDTAAILRLFFSSFTYSQVIQDTSIRALIWDSLSHNKIMGRRFSYKLLQPVRTIESTTAMSVKDNSGLFAGAFTSTGANYFGAGPQISYLTSKQLFVSAGYDLVNKQFLFTAQFKLHAKR